jgi:hypothetical protein
VAEYHSLLLIFAPIVAIARRLNCSVAVSLVAGVIATTIAAVPIAPVSLLVYLRGALGDLSMPTCILLIYWVLARVRSMRMDETHNLVACSIVAGVGLLFYPTALGLGTFDPYTLGYDPMLLASLAAAACMVFIWTGFYLAAICLLAGLVAYLLQMLPSHNLWDYLFDPLLWTFSVGSVVAGISRRYKEKPRSA